MWSVTLKPMKIHRLLRRAASQAYSQTKDCLLSGMAFCTISRMSPRHTKTMSPMSLTPSNNSQNPPLKSRTSNRLKWSPQKAPI